MPGYGAKSRPKPQAATSPRLRSNGHDAFLSSSWTEASTAEKKPEVSIFTLDGFCGDIYPRTIAGPNVKRKNPLCSTMVV